MPLPVCARASLTCVLCAPLAPHKINTPRCHRNKECLSLGCDEVPLFWGRSPVDMYRDFMDAFANTFQHMFGSVISEITVGLGPAGELRYPSYPEGDAR